MSEAEAIPRPVAGQVWNPERGGMWRTIVAVHPAGVEWTASPDRHAFERWETWDKWVRDMLGEYAGMSVIVDVTDAVRLIDAIRPHLAGKPAPVQGAALADLLATWIAGHSADTPTATTRLREALLREHMATVRKLIGVSR